MIFVRDVDALASRGPGDHAAHVIRVRGDEQVRPFGGGGRSLRRASRGGRSSTGRIGGTLFSAGGDGEGQDKPGDLGKAHGAHRIEPRATLQLDLLGLAES